MNPFILDSHGYFRRDGHRFWPGRCNYVTASAGARFWRAWPAAKIRADLAGMLERAWRTGANGFLFWCWRDVRAPIHPYDKAGRQRTRGLIADDGRVKPGLEPFVEFARELTSGVRSIPPGAIQTVGHAAGFRESRTPTSDVGVLLCPPVSRTPPVVNCSVWHPVPPAVMPRSATAATVAPNGQSVLLLLPQEWCVRDNQRNPGNDPVVQTEPYAGADSLLQDHDGHPLLVRHRLGAGEIWALLPLCRTDAHPEQAAERAFATALVTAFLRGCAVTMQTRKPRNT